MFARLVLRELRTLPNYEYRILLKQQSQSFHWPGTAALQRLKPKQTTAENSLQEAQARADVSTDVRPLAEKIKENTKTASYTAIIIAGVGVTGFILFHMFKELFSSSSVNNIYSKALDLVKEDPRVQDALGAPIKGFGEETRRGRRNHVAHSKYERHGVPHMCMQFYVQGIRNRATVQLESRLNSSGNVEYRYLIVQLDYYPHTSIVLEDNRHNDPVPPKSSVPSTQDWNGSQVALTSYRK